MYVYTKFIQCILSFILLSEDAQRLDIVPSSCADVTTSFNGYFRRGWKLRVKPFPRLGCPREQNSRHRISYFYTLLGFLKPGGDPKINLRGITFGITPIWKITSLILHPFSILFHEDNNETLPFLAVVIINALYKHICNPQSWQRVNAQDVSFTNLLRRIFTYINLTFLCLINERLERS